MTSINHCFGVNFRHFQGHAFVKSNFTYWFPAHVHIVIDFELEVNLHSKRCASAIDMSRCVVRYSGDTFNLPKKVIKAGTRPKMDDLRIGNFVCHLIRYKLILIATSDKILIA